MRPMIRTLLALLFLLPVATAASAQEPTEPESLAVPAPVLPPDSSIVPEFVPPADTTTVPEESTTPDSLAPKAAVTAASNARKPWVAVRKVRLNKSDHNVMRTGPGNDFAIVGVYLKKASFEVIAKSGDWYNVRLSDSETGWIHSSLCEEFDDMSDLEFQPNPKLYSRTGSYVLTGYVGGYAFDRKSNSLVVGARLGYYVLDRLQADAGLAWTHVNRPAEIVEELFGLTLEEEDFDMLFYDLGATFEILPGRQMVPFVTGGVGSSIMLGRAEPSFNYGAGTLLFLAKRTTVRWEVRGYRFISGSDNARVNNNNIAFTIGTSLLF